KVTGRSSATRVPVTVVTTGDGLVGIRPGQPGALKQGDQVVTGENYLTSPLGRGSPRTHSGQGSSFKVVPGSPAAAQPGERSSGSARSPTPTGGRRPSTPSSRRTWSSTGASTSPSPGRRVRASRRC